MKNPLHPPPALPTVSAAQAHPPATLSDYCREEEEEEDSGKGASAVVFSRELFKWVDGVSEILVVRGIGLKRHDDGEFGTKWGRTARTNIHESVSPRRHMNPSAASSTTPAG